MTLLAQTGLQIPTVEFSAFAPELLLATAALALLLLAVGDEVRILTAVAIGVLYAGVGVAILLAGPLAPGVTVIAFGAAVVGTTIAFDERPPLVQAWVAGFALAAAVVLTGWQWSALYDGVGALYLSGALALDGVALYTRLIVYLSALLALPIGYGYLQDRGVYRLEFESLLLFSAAGMAILAAAADLLLLFIALELLSLSLYIMVGIARRDRRSQEASIKYFVLGAVASAILVYGIALLYTATGTIDIAVMRDGLALVTTPAGVAFLGVALVTVGLAFKAAAVPFHFWTPDVYQGSPTNVTAFMAAATKAAAFAALLRVFVLGFGRLEASWVPVLAVVAAVTMLLGALAAIVQRDVKRVLAYSSIAHVGYALIGVTSASGDGVSSTLFYLLTYAVSSIAAFGCVVAVERRRRGEVALVDLKGLARTSPLLSSILGLSLLSLAGIPATAGFTGKFAVFRAGVAAGLEWLVVIGVVSSVIAAFFYLRLIGAMVLEDPDDDTHVPVMTTGLSTGISVAAVAIVYLGVAPAAFVELAERAVSLAR